MALKLYKTQFRNIKRNTKKASAQSRYYAVFDWKNPADGEDAKKTRYRIPLGQMPISSKKRDELARDAGIRAMDAIKAPPPPKAATTEMTLGEALEDALSLKRPKLKPKTLARYELCNRTIAKGLGEDTALVDITEAMILKWIAKRQQTVQNATINRALTRLKAVLKRARKKKWIDHDPSEDIEPLWEPGSRERWPSDEEMRKLWSVCNPWFWDLLWFLAMTGLRTGECFGLRWDQIRDGQIRLGWDTKGKRPRTIPIIPDVQAILDRRKEARTKARLEYEEAVRAGRDPKKGDFEELVFVTEVRKAKIHPSNLNRDYWNPARAKAGIENLRLHDFRHAFCSWITQLGGDVSKLQKLAGHADIRTTMGYSHLAPEHLLDTVELLQGKRRHLEATPIGRAPSKVKGL